MLYSSRETSGVLLRAKRFRPDVGCGRALALLPPSPRAAAPTPFTAAAGRASFARRRTPHEKHRRGRDRHHRIASGSPRTLAPRVM